ncbi:MAG: preprotein translocase subunit SecG [Mogibacterium sp.]|nr:preprotein translocase subunit SecG [Mogibacterium sp.]
MHNFLMVVLLLSSIVLIASILLQSGNSSGLSGSIAGGAEQLFGKKKSRGYDALLSKITTVCAVIYILSALIIVAVFN